jgi:hypothetical protein
MLDAGAHLRAARRISGLLRLTEFAIAIGPGYFREGSRALDNFYQIVAGSCNFHIGCGVPRSGGWPDS